MLSTGELPSLFCAGAVFFFVIQTVGPSLHLGGVNATAHMCFEVVVLKEPSLGSVISHFIMLVLSRYQGVELTELSIFISFPLLSPFHGVIIH